MGKGQIFITEKKMKYVAAYCLLALSGKDKVNEADLTKFLKAAGCEVNADSVKAVCEALAGKQLHEVINNGMGKVASLGGGGSSGAPAQQSSGNNNATAAKEEAKEAEPEEEEEDMDLGDLFG